MAVGQLPYRRPPLLRDFEGINQAGPDSQDLSLSGNFKGLDNCLTEVGGR